MPKNKYEYNNPDFNKIIENIQKETLELKDVSEFILKTTTVDKTQILKELLKLGKQKQIFSSEIISQEKKKIATYLDKKLGDYLIDYSFGYRQLTRLFDSKDIEEIIINGLNKIFIIDRYQNKVITGIEFTEKEYDWFINILKNTVKKDFDKRKFIDGTLPDRSRLNIVSKNVCGFNAITIRKFTQKPLTIIDLINSETIDSYTAAYLWTIVDGFKIKPANIFVCGGTGCGKTTFLNILLDFINNNERIVLIEDTTEIDITNFNDYVSLISDISDEESLYAITLNTMRMRPDRIIIGEVRGREVQGLFVAMDTGHNGCMATIHANNSEDTIIKLINKPMEISEMNLTLLDLIIILKKGMVSGKIIRKLSQITEISRVGNINLNNIYKDDDCVNCTTNIMTSHVAEKLCDMAGISKVDLKKIVTYRARLLDEICSGRPNITREDFKNIIHASDMEYDVILKNK